MKEPTREEYISIIMQLIYFKQAAEKVILACDLIKLEEAIQMIRYWYQFIK